MLAVMVRSLGENLRRGFAVHLYVLEQDVSHEVKTELTLSWSDLPVEVQWMTPDTSRIRDSVRLDGYAGVPATYFRLLIADLLPSHLLRAIYLDCDLLVLGDIAELWSLPFEGRAALAVQIRPPLAVNLDVLPSECGITSDLPAFNAGVLVVNLEQWRTEQLGARALDLATRYASGFRSWDQDALNCALIGRWGRLPLAWNYRPEALELPEWRPSGYSRDEAIDAVRKPKIVHFVGAFKPWDPSGDHAYARSFFAFLDRTRWRGWRPARPDLPARARARLMTRPHRQLARLVEVAVKTRRAGTSFRPFVPTLLGVLARAPWTLLTYPLSASSECRRLFASYRDDRAASPAAGASNRAR